MHTPAKQPPSTRTRASAARDPRQRLHALDVPERLRDIDARARLPGRPERRAIPRVTRPTRRPAPLREIERHTGRRPPQLISQIPVMLLNLHEHRPKPTHHRQHQRISLQHVTLPASLRARLREGTCRRARSAGCIKAAERPSGRGAPPSEARRRARQRAALRRPSTAPQWESRASDRMRIGARRRQLGSVGADTHDR
jgi:hypothetical protein